MSKYLDPRFSAYSRWVNFNDGAHVSKAFKLFRHETGVHVLQNRDAFREWCYALGVPTEEGLAAMLQKYEEVFN